MKWGWDAVGPTLFPAIATLAFFLATHVVAYSNNLRMKVTPGRNAMLGRRDGPIMQPSDRVTVPALAGDSVAVLFKWNSTSHGEYLEC